LLLDHARLRHVVDLQHRAYGVLMWLRQQLYEGKAHLLPAQRHDPGTVATTVADWVARNWYGLPERLRPESKDDLSTFTNLIASFLLTSFEVVTRDVHVRAPCSCLLCGFVRKASFVRARIPTANDQLAAERLVLQYLDSLVEDLELPLIRDDYAHLRGGRSVALACYGRVLLARAEGQSPGPAALVLWRQFAWRGSKPDPQFLLAASDVEDAEARVIASLQALHAELSGAAPS